ncbi:MAG: hypothetical protein KDE28_28630, partial [Anaerolineales bacterium]|nr:hypothetical protein [Anaerolineales bacterium]
MSDQDIIVALHPDPAKQGTRVTKATYDSYRAALLQVIPAAADGVPFTALRELVLPHLPAGLSATTSPGWWTTTVKLDLEARGLIERVP